MEKEISKQETPTKSVDLWLHYKHDLWIGLVTSTTKDYNPAAYELARLITALYSFRGSRFIL
jgi:hypothetical protein